MPMNAKRRATVLISCLLSLLLATAASAHQPYCEFADLTADSPWNVPDASISYAYFGNVYPAGDIDYFRFEAKAGQSILLSLSIPAIPDVAVYSPIMAVMGPGLPLDAGLTWPPGLELAEGAGAMAVPIGGEPNYWFEPFGQRYYWNYDDSFFGAPETAAYTVALWHPQAEIGRYSFVIGQREVFGGQAECFATYGEYWTPLLQGENPYRESVALDDGMAYDLSQLIETPAGAAPTVNLTLIPLPGGGYNVRTQTEDFAFTPQNIDQVAIPGEGHAHLYVDGVKVARVYGEWHFLKSLPQEAETLRVTLYANDHRAFALDGVPVSDWVKLDRLDLG